MANVGIYIFPFHLPPFVTLSDPFPVSVFRCPFNPFPALCSIYVYVDSLGVMFPWPVSAGMREEVRGGREG